ncbi:MAG: carboxypeptidase-like regulatory domain-containing protein [Flavobacteriaceae bacterium]
MVKHLNLSIQEPCTQNFNHFRPTLVGGFCNSCKKKVIDFTKMNTNEIIDYFSSNNTQNTCGRFKNSQLKNYDMKNSTNKKFNFIKGIGLACLALFSLTTVQAQEENNTNTQTESIQNSFIVKGTVSDETGPLPGANIILKGSRVGTASDMDGNFEFPQKLKKGDVLIFSYVGMETKFVTIENQNSASNITLKINTDIEEIIVVGKVATKKVYSSKNRHDN